MTAAQMLGCQACGRAITPCLVCANPIPTFEAQKLCNKTCSKCGVLNPLGDKNRQVLGIPPTLALPPAMIRRVQVARVGRRPYTIIKHAHYMHLRSALNNEEKEKRDEALDSPGSTHSGSPGGVLSRGPAVPEIYASVKEGRPLTFLAYMQDSDVYMHGRVSSVEKVPVETAHDQPLLDPEPLMKRMRLMVSPRWPQKEDTNHCSSGCKHPTLHQGQEATNKQSSVFHHFNNLNECSSKAFEQNFTDLARLGETSTKFKFRQRANEDPALIALEVIPMETESSKEPIVANSEPEGKMCFNEGQETTPSNSPSDATNKRHEHDSSAANHRDTSGTEPFVQHLVSTPQERDISSMEISNLEHDLNADHLARQADIWHHQGGEASTMKTADSSGMVEQPQKYFEYDHYAPTINEESVEQLGASSQKASMMPEVEVSEGDGHHLSKDLTGSEELPTHRDNGICSECGQTGEISNSQLSKVDEAELMRCCSQILELHCPHALRADLHGSSYPLCGPTPKYPLADCAASFIKRCRPYVNQLAIDMLRVAHSTLISSTQESTSEEVQSPLRGVEHVLSAAERYIVLKGKLDDVQGSVGKVKAACFYATRDSKAFSEVGVFPLVSQLIPRLLEARKQESVNRAKKDTEELSSLLPEINALLKVCFQYVSERLDVVSSIDNNVGSSSTNLGFLMVEVDHKPALDAVQIAVPLWLRLYHDIAHTAGLLN